MEPWVYVVLKRIVPPSILPPICMLISQKSFIQHTAAVRYDYFALCSPSLDWGVLGFLIDRSGGYVAAWLHGLTGAFHPVLAQDIFLILIGFSHCVHKHCLPPTLTFRSLMSIYSPPGCIAQMRGVPTTGAMAIVGLLGGHSTCCSCTS